MRYLTVIISFLLIVSCNQNKKYQSAIETALDSLTILNVPIDSILKVPAGFQKEYVIVKEEDLSYSGIGRRQARMTVPSGLSEDELLNNIKAATLDLYERYQPDGISILVYEEGDIIDVAYSVAMGEFAPNGEWSQVAANVSLDKYKLVHDIREGYFKPKEKTIKVGSTIKLYKETEYDRAQRKDVKVSSVALSNSATEWVKENIIIRIPNHTEAKIIDVYERKMPDGSMFIRYQIEVIFNSKKFTGWIHSEEIEN